MLQLHSPATAQSNPSPSPPTPTPPPYPQAHTNNNPTSSAAAAHGNMPPSLLISTTSFRFPPYFSSFFRPAFFPPFFFHRLILASRSHRLRRRSCVRLTLRCRSTARRRRRRRRLERTRRQMSRNNSRYRTKVATEQLNEMHPAHQAPSPVVLSASNSSEAAVVAVETPTPLLHVSPEEEKATNVDLAVEVVLETEGGTDGSKRNSLISFYRKVSPAPSTLPVTLMTT